MVFNTKTSALEHDPLYKTKFINWLIGLPTDNITSFTKTTVEGVFDGLLEATSLRDMQSVQNASESFARLVKH
jgi:hypothetical protein